MLRIIPIGWVGSALQREVTTFTEPPEDVARAGTIVVVDFEDPVLVAHGDEDVVIVGCVDDRVGMRPVGEAHGMTIYIEVIKLIPYPNRLQVLVEVNDDIAEDLCWGPNEARKVRRRPGGV